MTLGDVDEILPLLDYNRSEENEPNTRYQTLVKSYEVGSNVRSELKLNEDGLSVGKHKNVTEPRKWLSDRQNYSSNQHITYIWKNINVYDSSQRKNPVTVWKKISNLVKREELPLAEPKHILKDAYGAAHPGELLAIMGSSGAGKTTLLNTLTFRSGSNKVKGFRYINRFLLKNQNTIARLSAYVEQDTLFLGTLTVKEHLIFQSLIRMERHVPYDQRVRRVNDVIAELDLEKCKNTTIGCPGRTKGISGGERKRLAFATEILTNPPLMFCDEPTSGLDSFIALNVVTVLKSMAVRGKTVISTIHQPSSEIFSLFDKILILAEGRTAFLGKPNDAISFFTELGAPPLANYNPADFIIQLLAVVPNQEERSKERIKLVCDSFYESPCAIEIMSEMENGSQVTESNMNNFKNLDILNGCADQFTYEATWFSQFRALFWRSWLNMIKEPLLVKVRLFQTVVLSVIVGIIYQQQQLNEDGVMNINGVLFTFLTNMTFQNLFAVISVFSGELPIFMKEHSCKMYRVDVYFLSKTLSEIPIFLAIPIIFISVTYFWIGLNPGLDHFAYAIVILVLVTNVATSFGYFVSCISSNVAMALSIGPPVIIPFLLFGGYLLNSASIPTYFKWLTYLSWFKYGNEAFLINQWEDVDNIECKKLNATCPKNGEIILEIYHFQKNNFFPDIVLLFLLILTFRILAFSALFLRTVRYQRLLNFKG